MKTEFGNPGIIWWSSRWSVIVVVAANGGSQCGVLGP
jgi:hypothetical protein